MTVTRGTTNGNIRGSSETRRRRRAWLLETWASDVKLIKVTYEDGVSVVLKPEPTANYEWWTRQIGVLPISGAGGPIEVTAVEQTPTCRCYRCGDLLHDETVTVDRIVPGCHGGRYVRTNIRPACGMCNSETGGPLRRRE